MLSREFWAFTEQPLARCQRVVVVEGQPVVGRKTTLGVTAPAAAWVAAGALSPYGKHNLRQEMHHVKSIPEKSFYPLLFAGFICTVWGGIAAC